MTSERRKPRLFREFVDRAGQSAGGEQSKTRRATGAPHWQLCHRRRDRNTPGITIAFRLVGPPPSRVAGGGAVDTVTNTWATPSRSRLMFLTRPAMKRRRKTWVRGAKARGA